MNAHARQSARAQSRPPLHAHAHAEELHSQGYFEYSQGFRAACAVWKCIERSVLTGVL
jgi:hypothetical protein